MIKDTIGFYIPPILDKQPDPEPMISIQSHLDKLHLLRIYMENKIWCIGRQPFPYSFEYWYKEITKPSERSTDYWIK